MIRYRRQNIIWISPIAVFVCCFFSLQDGVASPGLELKGAYDSVVPLNSAVNPSGAATAYYNPALLGEAQEGVHLGASVTSLDFGVDYGERPASVDIGESIFNSRPQNSDEARSIKPLPTDQLPERGAEEAGDTEGHLTAGFVYQIVQDHLTLGFFLQVPVTSFIAQEPHYIDEREQYFSNSLHFTRYSDRLTTPAASGGLGIDPTDWLSIGIGVENYTQAKTQTGTFLPSITNRDNILVNADTEISLKLVPHGSIAVRPFDDWVFTSVVHTPYRTTVDGENRLQIWGPSGSDLSQISQTFDFTYDYLPWRVGFGARKDFTDIGLSIGGYARWNEWSKYKNRHRNGALRWDNTISMSGSAKWTMEKQTFGLSMDFEPSPVPEQIGRTNYVDNDRLGTALGYERKIKLVGVSFSAGIKWHTHRLFERTHRKEQSAQNPVIDEYPTSIDPVDEEVVEESKGLQTNNPGYPKYSSSGWVYSGGLHLSKSF